MASRKKTVKGTAGRNTTNQKKQKATVKHNEQIQEEIIVIIALVISILIFLSFFNLSGIVGKYVSSFLFGMFGLEAYILPVLLFFGTAFRISNLGNRAAGRKLLSAAVFFIALAALIQLIAEPYNESTKIFEYYINSSKSRNGGGIIGGILVMLLCGAFDVTATYVILAALMVISLTVITGKALLVYMAKKSRHSLKEIKQARMQKAVEEETDEEVQVPRRRWKTFELENDLNKEPAEHSKNSNVVSLSEKKNKKLSKNEIDELPIVNLDHLFLDENKTANAVQDTNDQRSESGQVISFEDELKDKFGKTKTTSEEYQENENIETGQVNTTKVEQHAAVEKNAENLSSTQVEQLNINQSAEENVKEYVFPPLDLLTPPKPRTGRGQITEKTLKETAAKLQSTLESFGVHVTVTNVSCGPTVTRYELQPEQGVKVKSITSLADDIKLNLAAPEVRIEAPIPGKSAVGIEVPNKEHYVVTFRELIESKEFINHPSDLAFAVGRDIGGQIIVTDIAKMPHLLIAGATGSGKSVCINTLIMSILYKSKPADVRMIMIDPKVVELNVYNGIPHLLIPVVTDPKKAAAALNWAVMEMTDRYKKFADLGVRDLKGYNEKIKDMADDESHKKMPQIIIIIDELADLMMVAPSEVEDSICRLAQMARAAGIHLIIATQRPSVNVITGLIKANIPSRIAFAVSSAVDSRTIIDSSGAEKLLGKGDMLFFPSGYPKPVRIQGSYVSEKEVNSVVDFIIKNNSGVNYSDEVNEKITNVQAEGNSASASDRDEFFVDAGRFIIEKDKASIGMLQREFRIGFNRAARIMDQLASAGVVGPEEGTKPRKILMTMEEYEQFLADNGLA